MIVAVVDYRAGNLASVVKALAAAGATPRVVTGSAGLTGADAIVIPGVGHFEATRALDAGDRQVIGAHVDAGVPLLGICLGMQWLFEGSDEAPGLPGLGVFKGRCRFLGDRRAQALARATSSRADRRAWALARATSSRAKARDLRTETRDLRTRTKARDLRTKARDLRTCALRFVKVPHVGWNTLEPTGRPSRLLDGMAGDVTAYFTHSYAAPVGPETMACTSHGVTFASVVERGRVFGAQFHPEKSGAAGVEMLRRFVEVAREANTRC